MTKQILLLLSLVISCTALHAQVTFNYTGVLGIAYGLDPASPFPIATNVTIGSPAFIAGIKPNDHLLKINDVSLSGIALDPLAEKFKIPMGVSIKILVEHEDKTQKEVVLKKAGFIAASYKIYNYQIFFDENKIPLSIPEQKCIWGNDCYNGFGYYVYDTKQAFYGEYENGSMKDGLYYYVNNGKPYYYIGEFLDNDYSGKGTLSYVSNAGNDCIHTGDFKNGEPNGKGKVTYANGKLVYEGGFKSWKYDGYGKLTADGTVQEGQWKNGVFQDEKKPIEDEYAGLSLDQVLKKAEASLIAEKKADSLERAEDIRKMNAYLNTPTKSQLNPQAYSGTFSSNLAIQQNTTGQKAYEGENTLANLSIICTKFKEWQGNCTWTDGGSFVFSSVRSSSEYAYWKVPVPKHSTVTVYVVMGNDEVEKVRLKYNNLIVYNIDYTSIISESSGTIPEVGVYYKVFTLENKYDVDLRLSLDVTGYESSNFYTRTVVWGYCTAPMQ
jgi:hypothetical protein